MSNYFTKPEIQFNYAGISTVNALVAQVGQSNSYWQGFINVGDVGGANTSTSTNLPYNGVVMSASKKHLNNAMSLITITWTDKGVEVVPHFIMYNGDGTQSESFINDLSPIVLRPQAI